MQDNENMNNLPEEGGFDIKVALSYFYDYWKWFVLSVIVALALAVVYMRYTAPTYQVTAKILLQDKEKGSFSSQADMLTDFGFQAQNTNVENEIEVINSMSVVRGAVLSSNLYVSYVVPGFGDRGIYKDASPVLVSFPVDSLPNMLAPLNLHFEFAGKTAKVSYKYINEQLGIKEVKEPVAITGYPFVLSTSVGEVLIDSNEVIKEPVGELLVTINTIESATASYMGALSIAPVSKTSSVSILAVNTKVPQNGVDFLNALIESYNDVTNEDKRQVARKTERFIIDRIDSLSIELQIMETRLAAYKKQNQLIDPKVDAPSVSQNKNTYIRQLEEIDLVIESSRFLNDYVNNPANDMKVIPTTFGVEIDQALVTLINNYNREVVERNQLLLTVTEDNPSLRHITEKVSAMQSDLRLALEAFDKALSVQRQAVAALVDSYTYRFQISPDIERELLTITRECDVKSGLYVMLLQKYEENALSLAVTADNLRCIDAPTLVGKVAPNGKMIYLLAFFLGFLLPAGVIYLRVLLRTNITSVDEVQKSLSVPHVGTIPFLKNKSEKSRLIVVEKNNNDVMAEAFRALRTNLQFVMKKTSGKVIMFTSTTSGEGKTFIAGNLAVSTALLGKKVVLVGLDIRKPRLAELFDLDVNAEGITSYLAADEKDVAMLDKFVVPSGVVPGLDILPAGIVPPNPAELLSRSNLDKAIEHLSEKYDYVILDTAPVGLVADSMIVSRVADALLYVMRVGYTQRDVFPFLKSLIADGRLENVSVVVNADTISRKRYGYGNYGYSNSVYGYGERAKK